MPTPAVIAGMPDIGLALLMTAPLGSDPATKAASFSAAIGMARAAVLSTTIAGTANTTATTIAATNRAGSSAKSLRP